MAKLSKGTTFVDGNSYNAAALNNLVDSATVLPGIITDWGAVTPDVADSLLLYDTSAGGLAKCTITDLIGALPGDAAAGTKSLRTLGTGATQAAAGNDSRFPASVTGIRLSAGGGSTDTAAAPKDLDFIPNNLNGSSNINWDLADVFYEGSLSSNRTYTFSNVRAGRLIILLINQNGHTVTFPGGWLVLGAANIASWNVYSLVNSQVLSVVVCSS